MKKLIIKGNFTIEGDAINMNNIAQPMRCAEIEIEEQLVAVRMVTFSSTFPEDSSKINKGSVE